MGLILFSSKEAKKNLYLRNHEFFGFIDGAWCINNSYEVKAGIGGYL